MSKPQPSGEQSAILAHDSAKHGRVLAGPGTGKSFTLVALLQLLLGEGNALKVRLLTFTRAATAELAGKLAESGLERVERPSTIHSFAISVLSRNPGAGGFPEPLRITDDWEYTEVVRRTLARRAETTPTNISHLFGELAANWESLVPGEEHKKVSAEERGRFLAVWREHRDVFGYTLQSELPYACLKALESHDDLSGLDFDLLIVDEYQDLNACDLALLKKVAEHGCRVIGAGDDDQSIYSFRRAHPEGIRRFMADYPGAADYTLSVTRRCGSRIVNWAQWVIQNDPDRPQRPPLTPAEGAAAGEVALLSFASERAEADGIAKLVQGLIEREKVPAGEVLILLRGDYNGQFSQPIRAALKRLGIDAADPDAVKRMMNEESNRKLLALVRLLVNKNDSVAWATLMRLEPGIGDTVVDAIYEKAKAARGTFSAALLELHAAGYEGLKPAQAGRLRNLVEGVTVWIDGHPVPTDGATPWGTWIASLADEKVAPKPTAEFCELLTAIDGLLEPSVALGTYTSQIAPLGRDLAQGRSEKVRIMTMASSKGLTVRATIVAGTDDNVIPRPNADLAEERRLLYVAMTRSKEFLFCTWARSRKGPTARAGAPRVSQKRQFSRFLETGPVATQDGKNFVTKRWP
ncbi:MAG: ATP-dependent helicase [Planctomycetes bacterium]|nr:ATP-dependent helicase [Planctomycetota bacterium]